MNILLGVSGSIAAKLTKKLRDELKNHGHDIQTVVTENAKQFVEFREIFYYGDSSEWNIYHDRNRVHHIDLTKWADLFLIAPATANTISKLKYKLADNLLTNCALAWDYEKPFLVAPAMNTQMWKNIGESNCLVGTEIKIIEPQEKTLFCGDTGVGAMADISDIVGVVNSFSHQSLPEKV